MPSTSDWTCADLWDAHHARLEMLAMPWRDFGACGQFAGPAATLRTRDDHAAVRALLSEPGDGRVLVIDSPGQLRIAMIGDRLAALGVQNGWAGAIINGPVRDSVALADVRFGIKALGTTAMRSFTDEPVSESGLRLRIGNANVAPGNWIYADADAVLVATERLT